MTPKRFPVTGLTDNGTESLFSEEFAMTISAARASFPRMIDQFLRQRVAETLPPRELERLRAYLQSLITNRQLPPRRDGRPDWAEIAQKCDIEVHSLERAADILKPGIDAIVRFVGSEAKKREQGRKSDVERKKNGKPTSRRQDPLREEAKSRSSAPSLPRIEQVPNSAASTSRIVATPPISSLIGIAR